MKVMVVGTLPSSLTNFRGKLIQTLAKSNTLICLATEANEKDVFAIEKLGAKYIDYSIERSGLNPQRDYKTYRELKSIFQKQLPDVVLAYTIKPIIWGAFASMRTPHIRFYALVTGLGFTFQKGGFKKKLLMNLVVLLYKLALKRADKVIFQNPDNRQTFIDIGIVPEYKTALVNGSGVDLSHFKAKPLNNSPVFLLIARLLGDKGIREYIKAANVVKQKYPDVVFNLVGPEDPSPDGITVDEITRLNSFNAVRYLGATDDVRPYIEDCSIFVLPSYHEGLPRTVLEAMATGRPVLTTDVPGCRETVINGENGWLVEKANSEQLTERMSWFIENQDQWQRMAKNSRKMAIEKFDVEKVNADLLKIMELNK